MSRKERVVALVEGLVRAGAAQARRGLAGRLLAGALLAVAVAGAVLMPRLLVGLSPHHAFGVGAPSKAVPPVVLAPGLPAQKPQPQAAAGLQSHAAHQGFVPSASTSQPTAQARPATNPVASRPPAQSRPQAQSQSQSQPTIHALTPTPPAPEAATDEGNTVDQDLVVAGNANAVAHARKSVGHGLRVAGATASHREVPKPTAPPPHPHPAPKPKPPKPSKPHHEPKLPEPPKPPKPHPDHPKPPHTPAAKPGPEAESHGHGNSHKP